jgi:D-inositol-3-phosphate glycosyltransferase
MRILFVLENYFPHIGGVEVLFRNLCEGLAEKGHKVDVVTHRLKGTKKNETVNGVSIHRVSCFGSRYIFTFFSIPKVLKLAKKADLIQTTTFNGAFPAWLASKILGKRCIITIMEVWVGRWKQLTEMNCVSAKIHDLLERMIYLLDFDRYTAISKSTKKQLIRIGKKQEKIDVVYPGVDYMHWDPKRYDGKKIRKKLGLDGRFVYLFTGRPGASKGLEYLIKAVPLISKLIPNSKLLAVVSKDRAYKKRYMQIIKLIQRLKVEDKVIVHSPVSYKDLPAYVKAADCVVVPSLSEGFGYCAVEACAMNKPVVASNTDSLPEVVSGRYVLVKPKSADGIAAGVDMAYNSKTLKSKLKKFGLKESIGGYLKVYKKLIKN